MIDPSVEDKNLCFCDAYKQLLARSLNDIFQSIDVRHRIRDATKLPFKVHYLRRIFPLVSAKLNAMDSVRNGWFSELSEELWPGQCFSLRVKQILHEEKSDFQDIKIIDT